ncbi:MAG TPA: DinB family protein [Pseudonocardiaceae bacterium]|jgi:uncharacterized damage-inducible protein DinB|nr:DinB family protein [Pseudonocardiaceae bacterium]
MFPDELVSTATEREILETFLDGYRTIVRKQLDGLSEPAARTRLVPSATTPAALVKHLAAVERSWFQRTFAQRTDITGHAYGDDKSWVVTDQDTVKSLLAEYEQACETSKAVAQSQPLDKEVPHHRMGKVSLRWIYVHMIEETARHAGHADILREQIDGTTEFDM